jgi:hypothetical protein
LQEREAELDKSMPQLGWRERYIYFEFETHRTALTQDEIEVPPHFMKYCHGQKKSN